MSDDGTAIPSRTERRRRETRAALQEAIIDLLIDPEQPRITSRLVAEQADVAVGTFYNHFDTIEDALSATLTPLQQIISDELLGFDANHDPSESVGIVLARLIHKLRSEPRKWMAARRAGWEIEPAPDAAIAQRFIDLGTGVEPGEGAARRASILAARALTSMIDEITAEHLRPRLPGQLGRMIAATQITDPPTIERLVAALEAEYERLTSQD